MLNFLCETIGVIESHDKCVSDIKFIGYRPRYSFEPNFNIRTDWDSFVKMADFEYDNDFGGEEIPLGLVVVGTDWWLERHEYDGAEWWEFKTMPNINDYYYDVDFEEVLKQYL